MSEKEQQHDALDDLDAFLDEFGKQPQGTEDVAQSVETAGNSQDEVDDVPVLDVEEVDVAADSDDEELPELSTSDAVSPDEFDLAGDVADEARRETVADTAMDDQFDFPPDPVPVAAKGGDMSREGINIMAADDEEPVAAKRGLDMSVGGVALFALLVAAGSLWYALSLQGQLTEMRAELAQPRQSAGFASGPDRQTQEELGRLNQRINELSVQLDGPTASLSESNQRELADIFSRMDGIDKAVTDLREEMVALQRSSKSTAAAETKTTTTTKAAPAKTVAKPVAQDNKAKTIVFSPSTSKRSGDWVVNIASLTDAKAAAVEQQRLKKEGIDVEVQEVVMSGRTWYRIRAVGFVSRQEAQVYGDMLREHVKGTPWVGQK